jgi:hypothetical protein
VAIGPMRGLGSLQAGEKMAAYGGSFGHGGLPFPAALPCPPGRVLI